MQSESRRVNPGVGSSTAKWRLARPTVSYREATFEEVAPRVLVVLYPVYRRYILKYVSEREDPLDDCSGFDWDEANTQKNWERHRVSPEEAEDIFFNEPLVVRSDIRHSRREKRYYALGQTGSRRCLFVAFTIRRSLVRVISVRDMNRRERDCLCQKRR